MSATQSRRPRGRAAARPGANGQPTKIEVTPEQLAAAAEYETAIAAEADAIWEAHGDDAPLTPGLFRKLRVLLRRPVHEGFISEVSAGKGKPYPSKGIRSIQVQIDRLDNVLHEGNWGWRTDYLDDNGTLAEVTAWVGPEDAPLFVRRARGGVDRGSTAGNTHKGTETNAGKPCLARLGVGHEVYLGLTDLDPDVSEEAAEVQGNVAPVAQMAADSVGVLRDHYEAVKAEAGDEAEFVKRAKLKLGSLGVSAGSLGRALAAMTPAQGADFDAWLADYPGDDVDGDS
jgi:hypothetical protein